MRASASVLKMRLLIAWRGVAKLDNLLPDIFTHEWALLKRVPGQFKIVREYYTGTYSLNLGLIKIVQTKWLFVLDV